MRVARYSIVLLVLSCSPLLFAQEAPVEPAEVSDDEPAPEEPPAPTTPEPEPERPAPIADERPSTAGANKFLLLAENAGRAQTNRNGALALGVWSLGNFAWATVGLVREPDDRERAFHLTNVVVNLVVGGVAVGTYFANVPNDEWPEWDAVRTLGEAHSTEKLALLTAGLDFAVIATGAFFTAKGNQAPVNEGMIGTGRSLMLQGAFLAAFDIVMFTFHALRRTDFAKKLANASR